MATKTVQPSASLAAGPPIISFGVLMVLAVVGILGMVLVMINPVLRMMANVIISGAIVYFFMKGIKCKKAHKPIYFLGSFFALVILLTVAPAFMTLYPPTSFATTGEAALAQVSDGGGVAQPQAVLMMTQIIVAGTFAGIFAGRSKTTVQLVILSAVAALLSVVAVFLMLVIF